MHRTTWFDSLLAEWRTRVARRHLPDVSQKSILDLGCGEVPTFLEETPAALRVGSDFRIWEGWSVAADSIDFVVADLSQGSLPFGDSSYDAVVMLAVLEHISEERIPCLLAEIRRVLTDAGRFVVTTPPPRTDRLLQPLARLRLANPDAVAEHQQTFERADVHRLLTDAGFGTVRTGFFEFGMNIWAYAEN